MDKVKYVPVWEGVVEGYVKNQVSRNLWRFERIYEFNDLVQEAYLQFHECKIRSLRNSKYQLNERIFMGYFKRSLSNLFCDLSKSSSKVKINVVDTELAEIDYALADDDKKSLFLILKDAPTEVKQVLSIIINSPLEILQHLGFTKKNSRSVFNNKKLCALIGVNPNDINLTLLVKKYLQGGFGDFREG